MSTSVFLMYERLSTFKLNGNVIALSVCGIVNQHSKYSYNLITHVKNNTEQNKQTNKQNESDVLMWNRVLVIIMRWNTGELLSSRPHGLKKFFWFVTVITIYLYCIIFLCNLCIVPQIPCLTKVIDILGIWHITCQLFGQGSVR